MTFDEFEVVANVAINNMRKLMASKGREYARTEDRFDNFNRLAADLSMSRDKVLLVYLTKHMDAIKNYVNTGNSVSEPIQGRILDALNYLLLLYGMVEERETLMLDGQRAIATQLSFHTSGLPSAEDLDKVVEEREVSHYGLSRAGYPGCAKDKVVEDLNEGTCGPALESYCGGEELVYRCNHYTQIGLNTFQCWLPLGHSSPHYNTILEVITNVRTDYPLPIVWMKP